MQESDLDSMYKKRKKFLFTIDKFYDICYYLIINKEIADGTVYRRTYIQR